MRTDARTNAGVFASSDASSDASINACAYAGTKDSAHTSVGVSPFADTNAGSTPALGASAPAPETPPQRVLPLVPDELPGAADGGLRGDQAVSGHSIL